MTASIHYPKPKNAGFLVSATLAVGPTLSAAWVLAQETSWGAANTTVAVWLLIAFWTPFAAVTFPAVLLGDHRDNYRCYEHTKTHRSLTLIPWLLLSPYSTARTATAANLLGCVAAILYVLHKI